MRKLIPVILTIALLAAPCVPASAAHVSADETISALETLELAQGTGHSFEPQRTATRAEALAIPLRNGPYRFILLAP